jgi:hypothetical protein
MVSNSCSTPFSGSNTLFIQDRSGEPVGYYNFLVDALVLSNSAQVAATDVVAHEVAHRQFAHVLPYNTFDIVRRLTGASYSLLLSAMVLAVDHNVRIIGTNLGELACEGGDDGPRKVIEELLKRLRMAEDIIDMGWRGLEIVAEIQAIDYGTDLYGDNEVQGSDIQDGIQLTPAWFQKTHMIEALMQHYPADFGGYHVGFGTFQEAMRSVWAAYTVITDRRAREEMLRLCTYVLYFNDNLEIEVLDPIKVITENASFARHNPEKTVESLIKHREQLALRGKNLIESIQQLLVQDIPTHLGEELVETLHQLVLKELGGGFSFGSDTAMLGLFHAVQFWSFYTYVLGEGTGTVTFSAPYLFAGGEVTNDLPEDWWRRLAFLEQLRQAAKKSDKFVCPFYGFYREAKLGVRRIVTPDQVKCNAACVIRQWVESFRSNFELIDGAVLCEDDPDTRS